MDNHEITSRSAYPPDERHEVDAAPRKRSKKKKPEERAFFRKASVYLYCGAVFLIPFVFVPVMGLSMSSSKVLVVMFLMSLAGLAFLYSKQFSELKIPSFFFSLLGALFALLVLSTVFSESFNTSFVHRLEAGTFSVLGLALLTAALGSLIITTPKRFIALFGSFLGGVSVVILVHTIRLFFGPEVLTLGVLNGATSSLVGSWYDLGALMGVSYIVTLVALVFGTFPGRLNSVLTTILFLSLFLVAITHSSLLLLILLVLSIIILLLSQRQKTTNGRAVTIVSTILLLGMLIFSQSLNMKAGGLFGVGYVEVHPSWKSTLDIARDAGTNPKNLLMGAGPNTFSLMWQDGRSGEVVESEYWAADFTSATSNLATYTLTLGVLFAVGYLVWLGFIARLAVVGSRDEAGGAFQTVVRRASAFAAILILLLGVVYTFGTALLFLLAVFSGVAVAAHTSAGGGKVTTLRFSTENGSYLFGLLTLFFAVVSVFSLITMTSRVLYGQALGATGVVEDLSDLDPINAKLSTATLLERNDELQRARAELALLEMRMILALGEEEITEEVQQRFESAFERAQRATEAATSIDPRNYVNWVTKGFVFENFGALEIENAYGVADSSYAQARLEHPTNPEIPLMQARLRLLQSDLVAAREYAREAIEMKKSFARAYALLAQIEVEDGSRRRAIVVLEEATLANPTSSTLQYELGSLYYNEGEFEKAISAYDKAIVLDPEYANALYFRGLAHLQEGERESALRDLERVLENNESNQDLQRVISNIEAERDPFLGVNQGTGSSLPQNSVPFEGAESGEEAGSGLEILDSGEESQGGEGDEEESRTESEGRVAPLEEEEDGSGSSEE